MMMMMDITDIQEFAEPLEEMLLPSTPPSDNESKLFQDGSDAESQEENNWLLSDGSKIPPLFEMSVFEESEEIEDIPTDVMTNNDDIQNNNIVTEENNNKTYASADDSEFTSCSCYPIVNYKNRIF